MINKGEDAATLAKQRRDGQEFNRDWHFELTLMPEEILDFLPWIMSLIQSYDTSSASVVLEPPHPLDFQSSRELLFNNARTQEASSQLAKAVHSPPDRLVCLTSLPKKQFR
jgi:hypothetical protein